MTRHVDAQLVGLRRNLARVPLQNPLCSSSGYPIGLPMSSVATFGKGLQFLLRGFALLISHPRLWIWALLPTAINLLLLVAMLVGFIHYYGDIYGWLCAHLGRPDIANPTTWYAHVADGLLWVVNLIFQLLIVLVSLVLLLIVSYAASLVVAGPFNDALSERVEMIATGFEPATFSFGKCCADIVRVVRAEALKGIILIAIPMVLLVLNLIPAIGGISYVALTFLFGAWNLGFAFADLPSGRRALPFRERWAFATKHRWALVGLGAGFAIPFFSLLFCAPLVVGGTLLWIDLRERSDKDIVNGP